MNFLDAVKKAKNTGKSFYFYYDDGSRTEYKPTRGGLLLDGYGNFPTFTLARLLSDKFTFADKKK